MKYTDHLTEDAIQRDDLRDMVNMAVQRGPEYRRYAALGLIDGVLFAVDLHEDTRFLLEVVKVLIDYDQN